MLRSKYSGKVFFDEEFGDLRICLDELDDLLENILTDYADVTERNDESKQYYEINQVLDDMISDFATEKLPCHEKITSYFIDKYAGVRFFDDEFHERRLIEKIFYDERKGKSILHLRV